MGFYLYRSFDEVDSENDEVSIVWSLLEELSGIEEEIDYNPSFNFTEM